MLQNCDDMTRWAACNDIWAPALESDLHYRFLIISVLHKTFLRARRWLQLYTLMGSELDKMTSLGTGNGRKQATD